MVNSPRSGLSGRQPRGLFHADDIPASTRIFS